MDGVRTRVGFMWRILHGRRRGFIDRCLRRLFVIVVVVVLAWRRAAIVSLLTCLP